MNRNEFMAQLARLLADLPEAERMEAIRYYNDYFDEAGPENEEKVIRELGSAGRVAASIKANLQEQTGKEKGENTSWSSEDAGSTMAGDARREQWQPVYVRERRPRSAGGWALLIILLVFIGGPAILGIGGGLLGVILGILGALFGVVVSALTAGVSITFGGAALFFKGLIRLFTSPAAGIAGMGSGLICVAMGLLLGVFFLWTAFSLLPRVFRAIVNFVSRILHKIRGGAAR